MPFDQEVEGINGLQLPSSFFDGQPEIAVAVLEDIEPVGLLESFEAAVMDGPEAPDLDTFEQEGHELGAGGLVGDAMDIAEKVLFLPAGLIVGKMAADAFAQIDGLADVDHFTLTVMKIID